MNPFINPNKRSIQLPGGCKDLMDVLKHSEPKHRGSASKHDPASRGFTHLVLHRAYREQATELVIGVAPPIGGTPMKYKVADTWYDLSPFPLQLRSGVMAELARMAECPEGQFPIAGVLTVTFGDVQSRWRIVMTSADAECILVRIQD